MDRNLLLAFALSFLVLSLWSMMQEPPPAPVEVPEGEITDQGTDVTDSHAAPTARYPELGETEPAQRPPARSERLAAAPDAASGIEPVTISVATDRYRAELSSEGASLRRWELLEEAYSDKFGDPVQLVAMEDAIAAATTPFPELGAGDLSQRVWQLDSQAGTEVSFSLAHRGVSVRKIYAFSPDGSSFTLRMDVSNASDAAVASAFLVEWPIAERAGNDFRDQSGAALADGELETTPLRGLGSPGFLGSLFGGKPGESVDLQGEIDWAGVQTPYFLSALFPDQPAAARARFVPLEPGELGVVQVFYPPVSLPAGQEASRVYRVYLGPKEPRVLEAFAPSAVASIDLGFSIIAPITRAFVWLLAVFHSFIPNYGWAIIVLTILVRVVMAPLTMKQMKSMERMRKIQPRIKEIQEKYADDRQKQSEAMMSLYRQEKVNPLGGCLPMVLQLPVFIGLFYSLRSSIQLRHAPFIGWIDDLSAPDLLFTFPGTEFPVRVLPLLMGASMFAQQKLTPMQMDPAQARMMLILMPGMLTVVSYTFPSGLVLYWMMSNVLAIAHQLWVGRHMDPAER